MPLRQITPLMTAALLTAAPAAAQPPGMAQPVSVSPVAVREVASGQTFVGTVRPTRVSSVGSAVDGRVQEYPVNEGQRVEAGDTLAQLRTRTLELERDAEAATAAALREELRELENGTRPEEKAQAKAALEAARAKEDYARRKAERYRNLYQASRSVNREEVQETESLSEQARQEVLGAEAALKLAEIGPREERIAQTRARLQAQEEVVNRLEDQLKLHTIRAPFDGYISVEHTEAGQWVQRGGLVAEVVELDEVDVEVQVDEEAVVGLRLGDQARVEIPAVSTDLFTGEVVRVVPQADARSRTFPVKVRVKNEFLPGPSDAPPVPKLKANMFARATLATGPRHKALLVPKDAIVLGGPAPFVYVFEPGEPGKGTAKPAPVQLGIAFGGLFEVRGPLKEGQLVVVEGNERLIPGQPLVEARRLETQAGE